MYGRKETRWRSIQQFYAHKTHLGLSIDKMKQEVQLVFIPGYTYSINSSILPFDLSWNSQTDIIGLVVKR